MLAVVLVVGGERMGLYTWGSRAVAVDLRWCDNSVGEIEGGTALRSSADENLDHR